MKSWIVQLISLVHKIMVLDFCAMEMGTNACCGCLLQIYSTIVMLEEVKIELTDVNLKIQLFDQRGSFIDH